MLPIYFQQQVIKCG